MDMPSMVEGRVCLGSEAMWLTLNSGLLFHAIIYLFTNAGGCI